MPFAAVFQPLKLNPVFVYVLAESVAAVPAVMLWFASVPLVAVLLSKVIANVPGVHRASRVTEAVGT